MQPDTDASAASMALASKLGAVLAHARRSGASHVDVLPDDVLRVVFPSPSMEQSTMTPISSLAMEEARLAAEEAAEMAATSGDAALEEGECGFGSRLVELWEVALAPTRPAHVHRAAVQRAAELDDGAEGHRHGLHAQPLELEADGLVMLHERHLQARVHGHLGYGLGAAWTPLHGIPF